MSIDIKRLERFPRSYSQNRGKPLIYLDNAILKPQCVIDALSKYYSQNSNVHRGIYDLVDVC